MGMSGFEFGGSLGIVVKVAPGLSPRVAWAPTLSARSAERVGHPSFIYDLDCPWNGWATRRNTYCFVVALKPTLPPELGE